MCSFSFTVEKKSPKYLNEMESNTPIVDKILYMQIYMYAMYVQEIWSEFHRSWEQGETAEALLLQFSFAEHCKYRMLKEKLIRG